jgi:hypothetical protein
MLLLILLLGMSLGRAMTPSLLSLGPTFPHTRTATWRTGTICTIIIWKTLPLRTLLLGLLLGTSLGRAMTPSLLSLEPTLPHTIPHPWTHAARVTGMSGKGGVYKQEIANGTEVHHTGSVVILASLKGQQRFWSN